MPESTEETRYSSGFVRRMLTVVWAVISSAQLVIWGLMSVLSMSVKAPFWLWTVGIGGVALLLWWCLDPARRDSGPKGTP